MADNTFIDGFDFESEEAKEGFGNLVQFMRKYGRTVFETDLNLVCAYFIKKDLESVAWWRDTVSSQTSGLEEQIRRLQDSLDETHQKLALMAETIRSQGQTIDLLLQKAPAPSTI